MSWMTFFSLQQLAWRSWEPQTSGLHAPAATRRCQRGYRVGSKRHQRGASCPGCAVLIVEEEEGGDG